MLEADLLAPARARSNAPLRGLPFWVFAALLLLSPLPFASVYPVMSIGCFLSSFVP